MVQNIESGFQYECNGGLGCHSSEDPNLMVVTDDIDEAFDVIVEGLSRVDLSRFDSPETVETFGQRTQSDSMYM